MLWSWPSWLRDLTSTCATTNSFLGIRFSFLKDMICDFPWRTMDATMLFIYPKAQLKVWYRSRALLLGQHLLGTQWALVLWKREKIALNNKENGWTSCLQMNYMHKIIYKKKNMERSNSVLNLVFTTVPDSDPVISKTPSLNGHNPEKMAFKSVIKGSEIQLTCLLLKESCSFNLYILTSVPIFSTLFPIHFIWY